MSRKVYTADVVRDGKFWSVHVPQVDRTTQARALREVDEMARDLVAIMDDVEPDSFDLDVRIVAPGDAAALLDAAAVQRELSAKANAAAAAAVREAALQLLAEGLTLRDIGAILGVSHQRAAQLLAEAKHEFLERALDDLAAISAEYNELLAAQRAKRDVVDERPKLAF